MLAISSWILQNNVAANNARKASCVSKVFQIMLLGYGKEGGGEVYRYDSEGERRLSRCVFVCVRVCVLCCDRPENCTDEFCCVGFVNHGQVFPIEFSEFSFNILKKKKGQEFSIAFARVLLWRLPQSRPGISDQAIDYFCVLPHDHAFAKS